MKLEKIVVASGNANKIREIKQIFSNAEIIPMQSLGFDGDIPETGETFKQNAEIKAKFIAEKFCVPALADDSGLCVDALGGAPGVYSARFSGGGDEENRRLLLKKLENENNRGAHFTSAVCLYLPDGTKYFGEGETHGQILFKDTGSNGFGYDCIFYSDDLKKSFGIASAEEKNRVSHRYRALCDLAAKLKKD